MDKSQVKLDPKLQAAYERVMGGSSGIMATPEPPKQKPESTPPPPPPEPSSSPVQDTNTLQQVADASLGLPQQPTQSPLTNPTVPEIDTLLSQQTSPPPTSPASPPTAEPGFIALSEQTPVAAPVEQKAASNEMVMINPAIIPSSSSPMQQSDNIPLRRSTESLVSINPSGATTTTIPAPQSTTTGMVKKEKNFPTAIITVGLIIFFIIYTIVWMIVLKIPIPFL